MMKKRIAALVTAGVLALSMLTGCGSKQESWKVTCPWAPSGVAAMVSQKAAAKSPDYSDNKITLVAEAVKGDAATVNTWVSSTKANDKELVFAGEGLFAITETLDPAKLQFSYDDFEFVENLYSSVFVLSADSSLNLKNALYKIGLVLQGQDTSANSGLIEGVRSVLTQEQVDLHVFLTDNKFCNERRCLETVVHQNFHGFIVDGVKSSILSPNLDCYKELYRRKIPVIFYNNFYRNLRCPRVTINDIECAHQLIERLMDAGHSHIAGIFVYDNYQSVEKFQGMAEAMRNRGLELNDDYIKWCISDEAHNESYVRSIERFLKSIPKCTAIVCCNYIIYRLVMKTLQKMGKTVPEDYSLVCFDYSEETYRQEDVTCSVEQGFEMGRQLALRLMEMISTGECDDRNYTYVMKPILYDGHSIRKLKKVK